QALVRLGALFHTPSPFGGNLDEHGIDEIVTAAFMLQASRIGGLIAIQRHIGLRAIIESSQPIDAAITYDTLQSLFSPTSPCQDGAVIVTDNRLAAAGAFFPITLDNTLSRDLGTRHRAAIGLSEQSDAVVIVISEETGRVSIAVGGNLRSGLDRDALRNEL